MNRASYFVKYENTHDSKSSVNKAIIYKGSIHFGHTGEIDSIKAVLQKNDIKNFL